jgi:hypothetical protein
MDTTKPVVKLDWSRLLGFDQSTPQEQEADRAGQPDKRRLSRLGAKVGTKGATARPRAS